MSAMVSIEEAQAHLAELIGRLAPGEELIITKGDRTVAKLIAPPAATPGHDRGDFPVVSVGPWPEGLSLRREDIYDDDGR